MGVVRWVDGCRWADRCGCGCGCGCRRGCGAGVNVGRCVCGCVWGWVWRWVRVQMAGLVWVWFGGLVWCGMWDVGCDCGVALVVTAMTYMCRPEVDDGGWRWVAVG